MIEKAFHVGDWVGGFLHVGGLEDVPLVVGALVLERERSRIENDGERVAGRGNSENIRVGACFVDYPLKDGYRCGL